MAVTTESYAGKIQRKLLKKQKVIEAASGRKKADLVLKNATFVNVFSNELTTCDIACANGLIVGLGEYDGEVEYDMTARLSARALLTRTSIWSRVWSAPENLSELRCRTARRPSSRTPTRSQTSWEPMASTTCSRRRRAFPIDVRFMLPSCVPATPWDESGANIDYRVIRLVL